MGVRILEILVVELFCVKILLITTKFWRLGMKMHRIEQIWIVPLQGFWHFSGQDWEPASSSWRFWILAWTCCWSWIKVWTEGDPCVREISRFPFGLRPLSSTHSFHFGVASWKRHLNNDVWGLLWCNTRPRSISLCGAKSHFWSSWAAWANWKAQNLCALRLEAYWKVLI